MPVISGTAIAEVLRAEGDPLPEGHTLWTLEERPELRDEVEALGSSVWPELMLHDATGDELWPRLAADFAPFQLLLDADGAMAAVGRAAPLVWNGSDADLPAGWDDQFVRSVTGFEAGVEPDTLGAIMIVAHPRRRGSGLGSTMVSAMIACARLHRLHALIACVRPTELERYPLMPIAEYARWTRSDGSPFDSWIRIHVRLGGRLGRPEPTSMTIVGSVAEWEAWTGMAFPSSGRYVVPGACAPVEIDREAGRGIYHDPNVWVIHELEAR